MIQRTVVDGGRLLLTLMNDTSDLIGAADENKAMGFFNEAMFEALKVLAPLALFFMALGVLSHLAQVRFVFSLKSMKPQFSRINPISGFKRVYSKHTVLQMLKEIAKVVVLGYIAYRTLWATLINLGTNGPYGIDVLISMAVGAVMQFLKEVALAGVVIGIIDYFMQRKRITGDMRMTKEEVKQEHKTQEGSPEMKGAIRQKQRAMSRNRMMSAIKDADVVVVNPVHVAVALKYQMDGKAGAPKVVAKGAGFVAEKIREQADEHQIPILQDIPLARTLHRVCEVDEEIPADLFEAVAMVLAFVFGLKNRGQAKGFHKMPGTPELAEYEAGEEQRAAAEGRKPELIGS